MFLLRPQAFKASVSRFWRHLPCEPARIYKNPAIFHSGRDIFRCSKKNFASRPAWGYEFWKPQNAFSTPLAFKVHFCYRFTPKPLFSTPQAFKGCFYAMFGDNFACEICFSSFVLDMRLSNCVFELCFLSFSRFTFCLTIWYALIIFEASKCYLCVFDLLRMAW